MREETTSDDHLRSQSLRLMLMPSGREVICRVGVSFLEALADQQLGISADCGARGTCGKCRIRFLLRPPEPSPVGIRLLSAEELSAGWRLACQHRVREDTVIEIPGADTMQPILQGDHVTPTAGMPSEVSIERSEDTLGLHAGQSSKGLLPRSARKSQWDHRISPAIQQTLTDKVCSQDARVPSVRLGRRTLDLLSRGEQQEALGLAIDVGTTTLTVHLLDLVSGGTRASEMGFNPQRAMGSDVITRIGHVREFHEKGLRRLQRSVIDGLNGLVGRVCEKTEVASADILRVVVVGNPTMLHLLTGISPVGMDLHPYTAVFLSHLTVAPHEIGLQVNPAADVQMLPSISTYVGADAVAGVLATSLGEEGRTELLVDIGTNGEIVLAIDGRLIATSTAAGPAFEGAVIRNGMAAVPGAIEDVVIRDDSVRCLTVGGLPPRGLCGTGLISAVHELLQASILDASGKLTRGGGKLSGRVSGEGRDMSFLLSESTPPVSIYQQDVRALQLGKAAIRAGIETLLHTAGVAADDLDRLYLAGAFGSHLRPERAVETGLLPRVEEHRIRIIGNAAGHGAEMVLLDESLCDKAERLARAAAVVDLSRTPKFRERFLGWMSFHSA